MTKTESNESLSQGKETSIWIFFKSVKLTLVLLIILAITSILGTIIPQQDGAIEFARSLSPGMVRLLSSLQLFDMYHSLWFRILIGALSINLIICSLDRFPITLKRFRRRPKPDRSKPFENIPPDHQFSLKGKLESTASQVEELLKTRYKNPAKSSGNKLEHFYCEKGRYSLFGVYFVHLSVLLILIGGIVGSIWGFEAFVNIPERESIDTVRLRKGNAVKKLGFSIHCDKFIVDFYKNGSPKTFQSDVSFSKGDKVLKRGSLLVNHPLTFKGITFYQASYGTTGGIIHLRISREGSEKADSLFKAKIGQPLPLPDNKGIFMVQKVEENLRGAMGPAALISISPFEGEGTQFWVFLEIDSLRMRFPEAMLKAPMLNPSSFRPYTFFLDKLETRYYTGLQVNRDPGVMLVWIGFVMIVIGLIMTFFQSHKKIWVRVSETKNQIKISVAGRANKNPVGLDREIDQLLVKLQNSFIR